MPSQDENDEIVRLIFKGMLQVQYDILDMRNAKFEDANEGGLLYQPDEQELPLEALNYDVSYQFLLVTGDVKVYS